MLNILFWISIYAPILSLATKFLNKLISKIDHSVKEVFRLLLKLDVAHSSPRL